MILPPLLLLLLQDVDLPETVVAAPRSQATVTSTAVGRTALSGEELRATGERSLPRAIGRASGVWIQETNLGGGSPVIRGLMGNQILILVDGVRLNDSTTRYGPNQSLNTIDPAFVDRVEILRGSASVLYGSDALGGVILVWTRSRLPGTQAESMRPLGAIGILDGEYDDAYEGGRGSGEVSLAGESYGVTVIGAAHDYNDVEAGDGETIPFTGYNGHAVFGAWDQLLGQGRSLRASAWATRDFDVPRTDKLIAGYGQTQPSNEVYKYALQDRRNYVLAYTDEQGVAGFDRFQARLSFRTYEEHRRMQKLASTTSTWETDKTDTVGLGMDWVVALGSDHLLTTGFDVDYDDVDSSRVDTDTVGGGQTHRDGQFAPDSHYTSFGVFLQDEWVRLNPWLVTAGVRYSYFDFGFDEFGTGEHESGDFDAVTGSLAVSRELGGGMRVTGTVAQGFRAPNLDDLAKDGSFASGEELHNPDLDPERSVMGELAFEVQRSSWSCGLGIFGTRIDDTIGRVLVSEGDPSVVGDETYMRDNVGHTELYGVEATLRQRLGGADSPFVGEVATSWVRGRQHDDLLGDVEARRIPPLHGRVALLWEPFRTMNHFDWIDLSLVWAADQEELHPQDESDPRIDPDGTDGWTSVDLRMGGPMVDGATWRLGFHNLFDEQYRVHSSGIDSPGFHVTVGVRIRI